MSVNKETFNKKSGEIELTFDNCTLYTNNKEAAEYLYTEIFTENEYPLNLDRENPVIIDCGSNIGCSTIFFKKLFPKSHILAFEPDPKMFKLLKKNVKANKLESVSLVNAALSDHDGLIKFYGQFHGKKTDSLGNSVIKAWGHKTYNDEIDVRSVQLSTYINEQVDFLKIDVEGSEQIILEDLERNHKFSFIDQLSMEVHETEDIKERNNLESILEILDRNHFEHRVVTRNPFEMLPAELEQWALEKKPSIYVVHAKKYNNSST